ncbi:anticodon-binding domain-containing protein [Lipomyces japonicus]|uniref:anticodon-binding domain-containing protein n=1 Tax=Lipomyces japonicus TaxID=56871 RepID=UPI0034CDB3A0
MSNDARRTNWNSSTGSGNAIATGNRPGRQQWSPSSSPSTEWVVGVNVVVTTVLDERVSGTVYAYCTQTNTVTVHTSRFEFRVLKVGFIKDIAVVGKPVQQPSPALPTVEPVNLATITARLEQAIRAANQHQASRGVGVSAGAQALFDALHKTLPVRWDGVAIVVLDEVRIEPPYTSAACNAADAAGPALARIKTVVEQERAKLKL